MCYKSNISAAVPQSKIELHHSYRYCWLNIDDGTFSNSWDEKEQELYGLKPNDPVAPGWKLIKFACVNDKDFQFTIHMKLR